MVEQAYSDRWIDFAQNKGKDTGAYCASPYYTHSYVFISWTGKMTETFVLATNWDMQVILHWHNNIKIY